MVFCNLRRNPRGFKTSAVIPVRLAPPEEPRVFPANSAWQNFLFTMQRVDFLQRDTACDLPDTARGHDATDTAQCKAPAESPHI